MKLSESENVKICFLQLSKIECKSAKPFVFFIQKKMEQHEENMNINLIEKNTPSKNENQQTRYDPDHYAPYLPKHALPYPTDGTNREKFRWFLKSKYFINTLWGLLYIIVMLIITTFILVLVYYRRPPAPPTLPDVFHEAVDYVPGVAAVNTMMALIIVTGVIQLLWPLRLDSLVIIRRTCFVYATVMLLRDMTTTFTNLPDPSPICQPKEYLKLDFYPTTLLKRLLGGVTCGDMIFSGHTLALLIPTLVVQHYFHGWLTYVMWTLSIFCAFMIIFCRLHYSVDVILSFIIYPSFWFMYHAIAEHPEAFADQLPGIVKWFFEKIEWSCPYYPAPSNNGRKRSIVEMTIPTSNNDL